MGTDGTAPNDVRELSLPVEAVKRRISVGLKGYNEGRLKIVKKGDIEIYIEVSQYPNGKAEISGLSTERFAFGSRWVFGIHREIEVNPCEYIRHIAEENDCYVDYSPVMRTALGLVKGVETLVRDSGLKF